MNREIKFRGLTINGDMVFGMVTILKNDYSTVRKGCYISNSGGAPFAYMVRHETIEQYTGLKDKNGVEIYEGDIVKVNDDWETYGFMSGEIRQVYFHAGGFRLKPKEAKANGHWLEDDGEFEVIGNIHQNSELL